MKEANVQVLLIGPIVFSETEDRISGKKALIIARDQANLEEYCDEQEAEFPSLMSTQTRWHGDVFAVDDGEARVRLIPDETDIIGSEEVVKYMVYFEDGAALTVCLSFKTPADIKTVLEQGGVVKVLAIHPADTGSSAIH